MVMKVLLGIDGQVFDIDIMEEMMLDYKIDIDLKKGLVLVTTDDKINFTESEMKKLFEDSGFTFRSMKKIESK